MTRHRRTVSQASAVALLLACAAGAWAQERLVLNVSPATGSAVDADGSEARPFTTLEAARDRVRALRAGAEKPNGPVEIRLADGQFLRQSGFELTELDSGTPESPLILRSAKPRGASLFAGHALPLSTFIKPSDPVTLDRFDTGARDHVLACKLGPGVKGVGPYPDLFNDHGGVGVVFFEGQRMPIARWPADGYATMDGVLDSGIEPKRGGTFHYAGDRPKRWLTALKSGGVVLNGYWRVPWEAWHLRVSTIDTDAQTITFAAPLKMGIGSKYTALVNGTRAGDHKEPWYAVNLIEEITRPGNWCIDSTSRTLYFWPPAGAAQDSNVLFADGKFPAMRVAGAKHVILEGLVVEGSLESGIEVTGGAEHVTVRGTTVRHTGGMGIRVTNATHVDVSSNDIYDTGTEGVLIAGGDRLTLTPSFNRFVNNHVHHTGRIALGTYVVEVDGVGVDVSRNLVHDGPLGGIQFRGNDQRIEKNEIHNVGLEGGDLGAVYTNGDWAARGNVVAENLIHHSPNANGVYLDDGHSGTHVEGNIVYRCRAGVFIGGGHDNVATGNLVVDSDIGLHLDDRGHARGYTRDSKGALTRTLNKVALDAVPWSERYPALLAMLARVDELPRPTGNVLEGNSLVACKKPYDLPKREGTAAENTLGPNHVVDSADGLFIDCAKLNFSPASGDLTSVPTGGEAGLFVDQWRTSLPSAEETGRFEARPPRRVFNSQTDIDQTNLQAQQQTKP